MPGFGRAGQGGGSADERRARWLAMAATGVVEAALIIGVLLGLAGPAVIRPVVTSMATLDLRLPPPPPPAPRHHQASRAAGSPAAGHGRAAPREAPLPLVAVASPVPAAPHAGNGVQTAAGDAATGTGAGAGGTGTGSGPGDGDGEGGDAEWRSGRIKDSDYPAAAREARAQGVTRTRISVNAQGRPTACQIRRSSGNVELDDTTCRLVLKRFRFSPARDGTGRTTADSVDYDQEWSISGYMGD